VTLSANPSTIERGQSSTLTWSTTNATNVSIDQGLGDVATSGSRSVSPSSSTTYTIVAKGEGGTANATTRITVTAPPPPPAPPAPSPALGEIFIGPVRDNYLD
jgi:peptidoglycan-associated lipoprotein